MGLAALYVANYEHKAPLCDSDLHFDTHNMSAMSAMLVMQDTGPKGAWDKHTLRRTPWQHCKPLLLPVVGSRLPS